MRPVKGRVWYAKERRMIHFDRPRYCDEYNILGLGLREADENPDGGSYCNLDASIEDFSDWMFYTGLKDKEGQEYYDSDIATDGMGGVYVIHWNRDLACFSLHETRMTEGFSMAQLFHLHIHPKNLTVIGNLYENPELLNDE